MRPEAEQLPHAALGARDGLLRVEGLQLGEALGAVGHGLDHHLRLDLLVAQHGLQRALELLHLITVRATATATARVRARVRVWARGRGRVRARVFA